MISNRWWFVHFQIKGKLHNWIVLVNHDAPLECCILFSTESFACHYFMMFRCVKLVYDTLFSNKTNIKNILKQRGNWAFSPRAETSGLAYWWCSWRAMSGLFQRWSNYSFLIFIQLYSKHQLPIISYRSLLELLALCVFFFDEQWVYRCIATAELSLE